MTTNTEEHAAFEAAWERGIFSNAAAASEHDFTYGRMHDAAFAIWQAACAWQREQDTKQ